MSEILQNRSARIAVVGASNAPHKFGNIITRDLMEHGYTVIPVNPNETTVEGLRAYPTLMDVPKPIDIVNVVTPPEVTREILEDAATAGCALVWLQEGSFDDAVLEDVESAPFETIYDECIMVAARNAAPRSPKRGKS